MIGLGSIIDRVTGLFGKTYLLAGFFPVLLIAAVSLVAGADTSRWIHQQVSGFLALDVGRQAMASGAAMVAVAMLGFIYWSANPWWRSVLQGTALFRFVREWLAKQQHLQLIALEEALETCDKRVFEFRTAFPDPEPEPAPAPAPPATTPHESVADRLVRWLSDDDADASDAPAPAVPVLPPVPAAPAPAAGAPAPPLPWMKRLQAARDLGDARTGTAPVAPSPALMQEYATVRERIRALKLVEPAEMEALCVRLEAEFALAPMPGGEAMDKLAEAFYHDAMRARARAENARNRALTDRRSRFPLDLAAVGPTRMANVAELYRDHALSRYELDPELMWLQLQRSAAKDESFRPILEEARLKLDVSVAMAVACALASAWAVVVAFAGHSIPVLLLTGVGLPAAAILYYRASITNLRVYGDAVTATVQLFRFDVLKALHLALPADSDSERRLWRTLTLTDQLLDDEKLTYVHT